MNNSERIPACSTLDVSSIAAHLNTRPFENEEIKLTCYHEEDVIDVEEYRNEIKEDSHRLRKSPVMFSRKWMPLRSIKRVESKGIGRIAKLDNEDESNDDENEEREVSESCEKGRFVSYEKLNANEEKIFEDGMVVANIEDDTRVSDNESLSSNASSCLLSISEHCLKRRRNDEIRMEISSPVDDETKSNIADDVSAKRFKLDLCRDSEKNSKNERYVIPLNGNPPLGIITWLEKFQEWSHAERLVALNQLIGVCQPSQVRHIMQEIEPQFQRDFIALLPKELALYLLSFFEPRDLLMAAQICRYWKSLSEDNLLWREKCIKAGIGPESISLVYKLKSRVPYSIRSPWKLVYLRSHTIEMNWRVNSVKAPKILKGHDEHVITCLQFCDNKIVSGSDDNTLKVWSVTTGKCLRTLMGHTGGVWSSEMSGNIIISGSTDRTLKVWNADTGNCIHTLFGHTSTVRCMHLHDKILVSGSRDMTLRVWDIHSGRCLHILVGHTAAVRCVQYDGRLVVSGGYDDAVKVWDPTTEACLHTLIGHSSRVYSLQFDGVHIVSGSLDTSIRVWDVETGALKHTLMGHQSLTSGMELRNNILVSGNADSTVKVWDIKSGRCLQTLAGDNRHESAVTCLLFNSNFVITSSDDGTVKLWDVKTGEFIRNLVKLESGGHGGVVWRIRASETKLVCAVGSRNNTEETKLLVLDFDMDVKQMKRKELKPKNTHERR